MLEFDKLPRSYKMKRNRLGTPDDAEVYRINGTNLVYKEVEQPEHEQAYKDLSKIKSDVFMFPKELVYVKKKFIGYIMDFIQGVMIKDIDRNILIPELLAMLKEVERGIGSITLQHVSILDINKKNIIITPDRHMKVIDTDMYDIVSDDVEWLIHENFNDYNDTIMAIVIRDIVKGFSEFIDWQLQLAYDSCVNCEISASVCIEHMLDYLQNKLGEEICTLNELQKALSLAAKR